MPKKLRSIFVANSGCQLIEADLSQFELRVLAHFSQDPALVKAFKGDVDVHRLTAAAILGKPEWQLSAKERAVGKVVNFAIIYGITPKGLVQQLDVTDNEAAALIDRYMHKYNGVAAWIASVERQVCQTGFVTTLFGRRRRLPEAKSFDRTKASRAKRQAVNFVLQGTAADLHKLSLIALHRSLPEGCRLLLTMHDAVLVEAPDWLVEEAVEQIRRAVTATPKNFSIPLKVESGIGGNWAECKVATQPAYA